MADSIKPVIVFDRYQLDEVSPLYDLPHNFAESHFAKTLRNIWLVVHDQRRSKSKTGETIPPYCGLGDDIVAVNFPWPIPLILDEGR